MKYEFIKNAPDDYSLKYKDKELRFNSKVEVVQRFQSAIEKGRNKLIFDLAKEGMSVKDLCKEYKKDGKTYYDNSNYEKLEKNYIEQAQGNVYMEIIEELFNVKYVDLMMDIELLTEEEQMKFSQTLGSIINGTFPSEKKS